MNQGRADITPVQHPPRSSLALFHTDSAFERNRMTQSQLITHLADKIGITKVQAKFVFAELNDSSPRELKREGSLRLAGLGSFRKRRTKARTGRNPATGEQIKIPARTRLRFTPAKALKDSVLGAHQQPSSKSRTNSTSSTDIQTAR
jgi:DNA-binding protein HU-beta